MGVCCVCVCVFVCVCVYVCVCVCVYEICSLFMADGIPFFSIFGAMDFGSSNLIILLGITYKYL